MPKFYLSILSGILLVFLFLFFASDVSAQVVINEFSSATSSDWIELYSPENVDVSGWILDDENTATDMAVIAEGTVIGPSSKTYLVVEVSNRLNKDGDIIRLYKENAILIDEIPYGDKGGACLPSETGSIGRYPDANAAIERFLSHTKESSNDLANLDPCPMPTPTSTPTPLPTTSPTSGPTPTPASGPTSTNTPTPRATLTPTVKAAKTTKTPTPKKVANVEEDNEEEAVLGKRNDLSVTPSPSPEEQGERKFPLTAGLFIAGGLGFIGAAAYPFLKNRKRRYTFKSKEKNDKKILQE